MLQASLPSNRFKASKACSIWNMCNPPRPDKVACASLLRSGYRRDHLKGFDACISSCAVSGSNFSPCITVMSGCHAVRQLHDTECHTREKMSRMHELLHQVKRWVSTHILPQSGCIRLLHNTLSMLQQYKTSSLWMVTPATTSTSEVADLQLTTEPTLIY